MRVRPREIRGIQQRVEPLLFHQADEEVAERLAARDEFGARLAQLVAGRRRRDGRFEPSRAHGRQLSGGEQIVDGQDLVARGGAAREVRVPRRLQRARLGVARRTIARLDVRRRRIDYRGAGGLKLLRDDIHERRDLALAGEADEPLAQEADARAFERGGIERGRERSADMGARVPGGGIFRVGAGDLIEDKRHLPHIERHHAGAARQPARRADRRQRRERRGVRERVACVGPEGERHEAGGHGDGAAAARSRRAERRIVGVADRAGDRADAEVAERELVEVRLAEHHRAAAPHSGGHSRVEPRPVIQERQ